MSPFYRRVLTGRDGRCVESDEVAQIAKGRDLRGCHHSQRLHCGRLHPFRREAAPMFGDFFLFVLFFIRFSEQLQPSAAFLAPSGERRD